MAGHLVVLAKLKLLAAGHGHGQLTATLLGPFILKLPFSRYRIGSFSDLCFSLRLFLFRLSRIFSGHDRPIPISSRWERALRLIHERLNQSSRDLIDRQSHEVSFLEASMVAL